MFQWDKYEQFSARCCDTALTVSAQMNRPLFVRPCECTCLLGLATVTHICTNCLIYCNRRYMTFRIHGLVTGMSVFSVSMNWAIKSVPLVQVLLTRNAFSQDQRPWRWELEVRLCKGEEQERVFTTGTHCCVTL